MALDTIPKQEGGKLKAVASGTLPSGQPVIVNADGTVSVAAEENVSQAVGSPVVFESASISGRSVLPSAAFDSTNNRVVIAYQDSGNSSYGTAVVGTISGTSISFGTPVVFHSQISDQITAVFDASNSKVVVSWVNQQGTVYGASIVGTVSGTSISFGSAVTFYNASMLYLTSVFDSTTNKVVHAYNENASNTGKAIVGTVSGTTISFGSVVVFEAAQTSYSALGFDTSLGKVIISYRDDANSGYGTAIVGTVSGTSISFGTAVVYASASTIYGSVASNNNGKFVIAFRDGGNSNRGKAIVGTITGTTPSFGTEVEYNASFQQAPAAVFDPTANKTVIAFRDQNDGNKGKFIVGTVSGTAISFGTAVVFESGSMKQIGPSTFDSVSNKVVTPYTDVDNSDYGTSVVFQNAADISNLTSENYIGMSSGVVDLNPVTQALGSAVVFESATVGSNVASTFDSNSNKVVIVYQDTANSFFGTAVVGTVSGTSISFGTPVVFSSANRTQEIQITFDSNSNKVVIAYDDKADGQKGKAIVGTVSGTSISFGSAVVFNNGSTDMGTPNAITFDSNSNKVVIAFQDKADSNKGKAIVGTVSGTSISFGSEATFLNADYATHVSATFDSNSNKVVIVYKDGSNSTHGYAVVGTVSSTSISFGTPAVFEAAATNNPNVAFDTVNNKIVIAYADGTVGTAIVGTVSGTSISFGSPVIFNSTETTQPRVRFDATASKIVIAYGEGSGNAGTFKTGTVSGTSISFGSATVFESGATNAQNGLVYDSNAGKMVLSYYSGSNSGYGTSKVLQTGYTAITRGQVASGGAATVDIVGTVSTNQVGLTAGQQYYVQTDGTLSETPADPSVFAGTAISATSLVVKT